VIQKRELWTMPLAVIQLFQTGLGGQMVRWGRVMAMSTLTTLPILLLFFFFQREFVEGLTAGAIKR
jgi:multiple sugar transport system permease protein